MNDKNIDIKLYDSYKKIPLHILFLPDQHQNFAYEIAENLRNFSYCCINNYEVKNKKAKYENIKNHKITIKYVFNIGKYFFRVAKNKFLWSKYAKKGWIKTTKKYDSKVKYYINKLRNTRFFIKEQKFEYTYINDLKVEYTKKLLDISSKNGLPETMLVRKEPLNIITKKIKIILN